MQMLIYSIVAVNSDSEKLGKLLSTLQGFGARKLSAITFGDISAIVSETEKNELTATQTNALLFAGIIEKLEQSFTLLPMQFGSFLDSEETISQMLKKNYSEFRENLQKLENKNEFGLKIFCDLEKLKDELRTKSENENEISTNDDIQNSIFKEYVNRKLKEHRLEESLLKYIESIVSEFDGFLSRAKAPKKIRKRTAATIIVDAVFLLDKNKKDELIGEVENLQRKYPNQNFILTGPWPPYNFVDITIKQ